MTVKFIAHSRSSQQRAADSVTLGVVVVLFQLGKVEMAFIINSLVDPKNIFWVPAMSQL